MPSSTQPFTLEMCPSAFPALLLALAAQPAAHAHHTSAADPHAEHAQAHHAGARDAADATHATHATHERGWHAQLCLFTAATSGAPVTAALAPPEPLLVVLARQRAHHIAPAFATRAVRLPPARGPPSFLA